MHEHAGCHFVFHQNYKRTKSLTRNQNSTNSKAIEIIFAMSKVSKPPFYFKNELYQRRLT